MTRDGALRCVMVSNFMSHAHLTTGPPDHRTEFLGLVSAGGGFAPLRCSQGKDALARPQAD